MNDDRNHKRVRIRDGALSKDRFEPAELGEATPSGLPGPRGRPVEWADWALAHLEAARQVLSSLRRLVLAAAGVAAAVMLLIAVLTQGW